MLTAVMSSSRALGAPSEMKAWVDAQVVGLGDSTQLHLQAASAVESPSSAQPGVRSNFAVQGSSVQPGRTVSIINGVRSDKISLNATWTLVATKIGQTTVTPSVIIGGTRYTASAITMSVVPAGQARPSRQQAAPIDPWAGIFGQLGQLGQLGGGGDDPFDLRPLVTTDPRLALDAARGRAAFLHALVDKTSAVVGEQVTFYVYIYVDADDREPDFNDVHEATVSDFVKRSLLEDESNPRSIGHARVGGRIWSVKLVRKWALFPLKTGDLIIDPMSLAVVGGAGMAGKRESEQIHVRVSEPPMTGRPAGYVVGDVGHFRISAAVAPREVERGEGVTMDVELAGTGNLPSSIVPPPRRGVEWLTPETHEKVGAVEGDKFGGRRTFNFVAKLSRAGEVDLGELAISFWDPDAHAYDVARAPLGVVKVTPGKNEEADAGPDLDPLPGLPAARTARAGAEGEGTHLSDRPLFWLSLAASPLAFAFVAGGRAAQKRVKDAVRSRKTSPEKELRQRMDDAEAACQKDDPRAADAATARAIECAAITRAKTNVRAVAGAEVGARLEAQGVPRDVAVEIGAILDACEKARFSPTASAIEDARGRWTSAKKRISELKLAPRKTDQSA
jgi:hypothetical protein